MPRFRYVGMSGYRYTLPVTPPYLVHPLIHPLVHFQPGIPLYPWYTRIVDVFMNKITWRTGVRVDDWTDE